MNRLPREVEQELDRCGLPWSLEDGGKHNKIVLDGWIIGVVSKGGHGKRQQQGPNLRSVVRRGIKAVRDGSIQFLRGKKEVDK